jgi:hypothetical protein
VSEPGACPLCGQPLYAWITLPASASTAERTFDRCERCGVAAKRGAKVDLAGELEAISDVESDGSRVVEISNRASLQAAIGGEGWAAIDLAKGSLLHSPRSLELLAERGGYGLDGPAFPPLGHNQAWMWQTLLNGLTLHPNFAREVRAGRLRPSGGRGKAAFAVDCVATVLAAPLVALVSFPLELVAALVRRGGSMHARLTAAHRPGAMRQ